jgi:hypothetical protein
VSVIKHCCDIASIWVVGLCGCFFNFKNLLLGVMFRSYDLYILWLYGGHGVVCGIVEVMLILDGLS